jgi:hypothetical protein
MGKPVENREIPTSMETRNEYVAAHPGLDTTIIDAIQKGNIISGMDKKTVEMMCGAPLLVAAEHAGQPGQHYYTYDKHLAIRVSYQNEMVINALQVGLDEVPYPKEKTPGINWLGLLKNAYFWGYEEPDGFPDLKSSWVFSMGPVYYNLGKSIGITFTGIQKTVTYSRYIQPTFGWGWHWSIIEKRFERYQDPIPWQYEDVVPGFIIDGGARVFFRRHFTRFLYAEYFTAVSFMNLSVVTDKYVCDQSFAPALACGIDMKMLILGKIVVMCEAAVKLSGNHTTLNYITDRHIHHFLYGGTISCGLGYCKLH